jgi:MarR family transcriptional regulator for hemolysin
MAKPTHEPVGLQLTRTARLVGRAFDDALAEAGGSLPMWQVMIALKAQPQGIQRELAQAAGIEGPTLTHHLARMEQAGLVQRSRDPENKRVQRVELTAAGDGMFHRLRQAVITFDRRLRAGVSADEVAALSSLLERLRSNVGVE